MTDIEKLAVQITELSATMKQLIERLPPQNTLGCGWHVYHHGIPSQPQATPYIGPNLWNVTSGGNSQ